ncbi:MAG: flagellin [Clostridiales bacterium]|nr:flagellin [Clostridiales bacterium]
MAMVVQHNLSSMNASRNLGITTGALSKSTEKLSSGYKINRAGDNAAGLAISEKMRGQIRGLNQASANSEDGISMIQTAEGALNETQSILQRMRELAVQASNDTNTDDDRTQIQNEIDQLTQEVDRIATTTEFNTRKLLDGSRAGSVTEKAGKANVDATFGNSMVSATITQDGTAKEDFTDIIRIEVAKDFTEGQSTKGTSLLSDGEIDTLTKLLTTSNAVTLDTVLAASAGATSITNSAYNSSASAEENIKGAITAAKTQLSSLVTTLNTSKTAVSDNTDGLETEVKDIFKFADATKTQDGTTILKDGVTEADLKVAIQSYVDAVEADGATAKTSIAITEAKKNLEALFNTTAGSSATSFGQVSAAATLDVKLASGTTSSSSIVTATITAGTAISAIADSAKTKVLAYADKLASVTVTNDINQAKTDQVQGIVDTLNNTELSKAIINYDKALDDAAGYPDATDAKKAELQAAIDAAKTKLDELNVAEKAITVTDLFGSTDDANKFEIDSKVADDGSLNITLKNSKGDDTVITIENADKLKAGDVITITSEKYVESKQAATGKEAFRLQVGANAGQEVSLGINSMKAKDLEIVQTKDGVEGKALAVTDQASASLAVNAYDMALQKVSTERAKMGAVQNRLEHTIANLDTSAENLQSAESRIRDTDMAEEMTNYSKSNILMQAGQSMLAQANQSSQGVLSLLQ